MKAMLVLNGRRFPMTHDLVSLNNLLQQSKINLEISEDHLELLSSYAVRARYEADHLEMADAKEAIQIAKAIRKFSRAFLGIK